MRQICMDDAIQTDLSPNIGGLHGTILDATLLTKKTAHFLGANIGWRGARGQQIINMFRLVRLIKIIQMLK